MGEVRDWRQSFRDLELERLKEPPDPVATLSVRLEPVFPPDISIPPPMGAAIIGIPLVPAPQPQGDAEAGLIVAAPDPGPKPKPVKRKAVPKRASKRKPAARKKPRRAAARKPQSAARTRAAAKVAKARVAIVAALPPLPQPEVMAPLPRSASLAPYRKGGVVAAMGFWLRNTVRGRYAEYQRELVRLRAENESLRRQLEALTGLREAAEFQIPV